MEIHSGIECNRDDETDIPNTKITKDQQCGERESVVDITNRETGSRSITMNFFNTNSVGE